MTQEEKWAWAVQQLRARQSQLERIPCKDDFDDATRSRIKAFLGPWPRALEAAGLKEPRPKKPRRAAARKQQRRCDP